MHRTLLLPLLWAAPVSAQQDPVPTFTEAIAPIVFQNCTDCHRPGEAAPFALLNYADVRKRGRNMLAAIEDRFMPPWHPTPGFGRFRHEARLSDAQIDTFRDWVKGGMPEGPADKLPPLPPFTSGWALGEPDLVVSTQGAFPVPARGRDIYRNFTVSVGLDEDKWVTAIEVRPSARAVLHHTLVMLDEARESQAAEGRDGRPGFRGMRLRRAPLIAGWAVGGRPQHLPDGLAIKIPKGSDLVLQSHFHPSGKREKEQTTLGLYFAKEPPKRTLVAIQLPPFFGFGKGIDIPPREADYRIADSFELPCDVEAVNVGGHAHMLCRSMKMHATAADGSEIPLLEIRDWDFDWQNRYTFRDLVPLAKGSVLHAEIRYDNSSDNPNNPNRPPKRVRWGRETTDEMGSLTLMVVPKNEDDIDLLKDAVRKKDSERLLSRAKDAIDARFKSYDKNRDGKLQPKEVPRRMRRFFDVLDRDKDGALSKAEAKAIERLFGGGE